MTIEKICEHFQIEGKFQKVKALDVGNINITYKVTFLNNGRNEEYIVQRINKFVFKRPDLIMDNIMEISSHIINEIKHNHGVVDRNVLEYMLTENNISYYVDSDQEYWRCYKFIGNSISVNETSDLFLIDQAGKAFGQFQMLLSNFDASSLHESIPNFHNTEARFIYLEESIRLDVMQRVENCQEEIDFLMSRKEVALSLCKKLKEGKLPLRVTHNDTKCNNVLFDKETKEALAVIDLDTVMPGLTAYDYGDAIRSIAPTCQEDEKDLSKVDVDMEKFKAFTEGFISAINGSLNDDEIVSLADGILVITLELASRFLKDYIDGDLYFKTNYSEHNFVRAKCQIQIAKKFEEHMDEMRQYINSFRK